MSTPASRSKRGAVQEARGAKPLYREQSMLDGYLASILSQVQDAIISTDIQRRVVIWNHSAELLFRCPKSEATGRKMEELLRPEAWEQVQTMLSALSAGQPQVRHEVSWKQDGATAELEINVARVVDEAGRPIGFSMIARDIGERKRTEEAAQRLASIVESSADAIIGKDMDGIITSWNQGAAHIYGYTEAEVIGKPVWILSPQGRDEAALILQRLKRGERIEHYQTKRLTKDGRIIDVSLTISPIKDEHGKVIGASTIARDVTERKRAEDALRHSEKLAATGRLAASIAHEINNPLESVTNLLYLLEHHPTLDEQARNYLGMAEEELSRIVHITRQTLGFYREASAPVTVRVGELLESVLELYARKIENKRIMVERRYGMDMHVRGFPGELRQVFSNLIVNALEAVDTGGRLRLHAFASRDWRRPEVRGVRVIVADNGPGIPLEHQRHIFEPFFTTKGERGTGLGLWVTSGIVHKQGGSIRIRSGSDPRHSGTLFSVFLPVAENASPQAA